MSDQRLRAAERRAKEEATPDAWHAFVRVAVQAGQEEQAAWREICGIGRYDVLVWEYEETGTIHAVDPRWKPVVSSRLPGARFSWAGPVLCGASGHHPLTQAFELADTRWASGYDFRHDCAIKGACKGCPRTLVFGHHRILQAGQARLIGEAPFLCRIGSHRRAALVSIGKHAWGARDDEPAPCEDCGMILPPVAATP